MSAFLKNLLQSGLSTATSVLSGIQTYLIVGAVCAALGGAATWRVMSWHEQAQKTQVITKTVKQIVYQDHVTERVVTKYIAAKAKVVEHTQTLIQEVPVYVTPEADARCVVNLGTVRLWQRAVKGPVPDASAGADDAPSGLACSDLAQAIAQVAGQYDLTASQLTALQSWIQEQRTLSEKDQ
jgi:hypothetical protein